MPRRNISPKIWTYVKALSDVAKTLFVKEGNLYYITDKFANLTFLDKNKDFSDKIIHFKKVFDLKKEKLEDLFKTTLFAKPTTATVRLYKNPSLIDSLKKCYDVVGLRKLEVLDREEDLYYHTTCSCPDFYDLCYCLHSLTLAVFLKRMEIPRELLVKSNYYI